jgi:cbb3-type cytochrome oxidase subunit 3
MIDPTTLVLIGTGLSSLFIAFIEYAYRHKKRMKNEAA